MTYYYTESQIRAQRIKYNLEQLDEDQIAYCKAEALRLQMMNLEVDDNSLDAWMDCIAENLRIMNDRRRAQYCAEMGEQ